MKIPLETVELFQVTGFLAIQGHPVESYLSLTTIGIQAETS